MKIVIELDLSNAKDAEVYLALASHALGGEVVTKAKRTPKPTEPVAGNPDKAPATETPAAAQPQAAPPASEPAKVTASDLAADTPDEVKKLVTDQSKAALGPAILRCSKEVEAGGRTRAVAVAILEKYRPAGNTSPLVKVSDLPADVYPKLAADILAAYKK